MPIADAIRHAIFDYYAIAWPEKAIILIAIDY